jgi:hypothetical protein
MSTLRPVNARTEHYSIDFRVVAAFLVGLLVNFAIWALVIVLVRIVVSGSS